jgi:hypothetical protein
VRTRTNRQKRVPRYAPGRRELRGNHHKLEEEKVET